MSKQMTEAQEAELKRFERSWQRYKEAKATAFERARIAAEAEVAVLKVEAARDAHRVLATGVSKRRVGVVMKTSDYGTVNRLLSNVDVRLHFDDPEAEAVATATPEQEIWIGLVEGDVYRVTLSGSELEQATAWANWDHGKTVPLEYQSALFKHTNSGHWVAETEGWITELREEHPVVVYALNEVGRAKLNEVFEK